MPQLLRSSIWLDFFCNASGSCITPRFVKYLITTIVILSGLSADLWSQSSVAIIKGNLKDSASKQRLPFATITIFRAEDTTLVAYRLSDLDGNFKIPKVQTNNRYNILISYSGYKVLRKKIFINELQEEIDLGTLMLAPDLKSLDEVLVSAERPPVIVRNDTIEFNASSFKTLPNALVEDLLKKLPGVHIDKNGNITVNGKTVDKILVDGREFFGNDLRMATRNLPADIIEKVQVVNDDEQAQENVFLNTAIVRKIINLKLKKSVKKGIFGKTYAGGGTDERYESGAIINSFRDTLQLSLLAFSNNVNKAGFGLDEVKDIGGFRRSGYTSSMMNKNGSFTLDDISFGGTSDGIQTSSGAGTNLNTELSKKASLNARYFYGQINNKYNDLINVIQNIKDTVFETVTNNDYYGKSITHRFGGTLKLSIDRLTTVTIRPSIAFLNNNITRIFQIATKDNFNGLLNESSNQEMKYDKTNVFNNEMNFRKQFKKGGRMLYISINTAITNNKVDQYNFVENTFYKEPVNSTFLDQLRQLETPNIRNIATVNFNETITNRVSLKLSYNNTFNQYINSVDVYNKDGNSGSYTIKNPELTDRVKRISWKNNGSFGLNWRIGQMMISPVVSFQILNISTAFRRSPSIKQNYQAVLPNLTLSWNGFFINYFTTINEPRIDDIQPVTNNSNPVYLQLGNPDLSPSRLHSLYLTYDRYNEAKLMNYSFSLSGLYDNNAIVRKKNIDNKGIQTIIPVNVPGVWSLRTSNSMTKDIKILNDWLFSTSVLLHVDYEKRDVIVNNNTGKQNTWTINPSISYSFNWKDAIEFNQEYSFEKIKGTNNNVVFSDIATKQYFITSELVLRIYKSLVLESSYDYYINPNNGYGIPKSISIWNFAAHILFLKDRKGALKFTAFDVLNQNKIVHRTIAENHFSEVRRTALGSFFLLTFTYNISDFRIGKVGGRQKLLLF